MQQSSIDDKPRVKCVACSASNDELVATDKPVDHGARERLGSNYFKCAQW